MSRRRNAEKRKVDPDPKYDSVVVSQFVNALMLNGKKRLAERIIYDAIDVMVKRSGQDGITLFKKAIDNVKPVVEVKSRRIGGANYQVPVEVSAHRRSSLGIRWIIQYAKERTEKGMAEKLAAELIQASKGEGGAVKKKVDTHRMAEANRAFAHFRF